MYLSLNYLPVSGSVIRSVKFPVVSKKSGLYYGVWVDVIVLPCGRKVFYVPFASFYCYDVLDGYGAVFQSANSLFKSFSQGGSRFRLSCSRSDFYHRCHTDYRGGYRD